MNYRLLGNSGLRVSELALGTMTFGETRGFGSDPEHCGRIFAAYTGAGGNFIDTANRYADGESERTVGRLVAGDRHRYVIATKYSTAMAPGDPNAGGNHRKNMIRSVEDSLKRLGTDYIDLYWLHVWDFMTPAEEVMRAFDDLVRAGKVLYCGLSDTPAWIAARAHTIADVRGWAPLVGLQTEYSLIQRTPERELLPMAAGLGMGVAAWAPIGGGLLTGKYAGRPFEEGAERRLQPGHKRLSDRNMLIAEAVAGLAARKQATPAQIAIQWVRRKGVVPIVGARTAAQMEENLRALEVALSEDEMKALDDASSIELGFPHDFLRTESVRATLYAGLYDRIEQRDRHAGKI